MADIEFSKIPDPCTDEMVTLLYRAVAGAFDQMREVFPFSAGDAMSACLHLIVERALAGAPSREQARQDIIDAVDALIDDHVWRVH